jgi:lipopolysaccharide/colanic/teichoic acid biosynthesis glycosyltransferase
MITVSGDQRITQFGKFLRAAKLDELPQFWNVLKGDMSLVGPRPELPQYVQMCEGRYRHILSVRPGMSDLASIRFRNEEQLLAASAAPLAEYTRTVLPAKLDLAEEYIRNRSFLLDAGILFETLLAIIGKNEESQSVLRKQ